MGSIIGELIHGVDGIHALGGADVCDGRILRASGLPREKALNAVMVLEWKFSSKDKKPCLGMMIFNDELILWKDGVFGFKRSIIRRGRDVLWGNQFDDTLKPIGKLFEGRFIDVDPIQARAEGCLSRVYCAWR